MVIKKLFAAALFTITLLSILAVRTTVAQVNTTETVSSSGTIAVQPITLALVSSTNPAKTATPILISGQLNTGENPNYSNLTITIQYTQDQTIWHNISTVMTDIYGKFKAIFAFSSSGIYIVKATYSDHVTSYSQIVADRIVNLDGSEDSTDIQTAINSLPLAGGFVYIRSGLYDLLGKSIALRSGLTLIGEGIDQTIVRLYPTKHTASMSCEDALTSTTDITNLVVENFTLIQNVVPLNHHGGLALRGGKNDDITVRNLKVTDVSGAGISIRYYNNLLIENCIIERAWTGITFLDGSNAAIRNNVIIDTQGDGIFPQLRASEVVIENNELENIGDTAVDITGPATAGTPSHKHITVTNNKITNGTMRVTNALDVQIIGNTIQYGEIDVDSGQGTPSDVKIMGNQIVSKGRAGIGFYGAANSSAENNIIKMEPPSTNIKQSGISAAIWDTGLIAGNTIQNSANYGIDFGNWGLGGGNNIAIRGNTIQNYGNFGIYDNNKYISVVRIEENVITSSKPSATNAIFTENPQNHWTII